MEIGTVVEMILKFIMIFYFLDYIISPHSCEIFKIKNLLFEESLMDLSPEEDAPVLKYDMGESVHWVFGRITMVLAFLGCFLTRDGSPYAEVGFLCLMLDFIFHQIKSASLRDALYRLISLLAIFTIFIHEERFLPGLFSIFQ